MSERIGMESDSVKKTHVNRLSTTFMATVRAVRLEHLIAGISGGVVSTLVLHPLDLIKIRFSVDDGKVSADRPKYVSLRDAFMTICRKEGVRGLYKGVTPNVAGAGTAWGFYFLFYNTIKTEMQHGNPKMALTPKMHSVAATVAGVLTLTITNPLWVVKTRLCLQYAHTGSDPSRAYSGMIDGILKLCKYEGFRGLYKGFVPGMWGVSHGVVQFVVYEQMKTKYNNYMAQPIDTKLRTSEYLCFAAASKLIAAVTTYPYQVVRSRLQDHHSDYSGSMDCIRKTLRHEGVRGFYKGLKPNVMRVVPATAITFVVYEHTSQFLTSWRPSCTIT